MDKSNENKIKGKMDKVRGEAKDQYGRLVDDKGKRVSGKMDKIKGEIKEKLGEAQDNFKNND